MASYFRTRLPQIRHAALSLHKTQVSPCFHSSNDATTVLFPIWAANLRAFHDDNKQDGIDDATLGLHDSLKETSLVSVKKFDDGDALESHAAAVEGKLSESNLDGVNDGGVRNSYISLAELEKLLSDYHAKEDAIWAAKYEAYCKELRDEGKPEKRKSGKNTKKRVPVVVSLCNAKRVDQILTFPPEVLKDNRRLRQLFNAWKKECNVCYGSNAEEMEKFKHFKFNVFWNDHVNRTDGLNYSLGITADILPGYTWLCPKKRPCCGTSRSSSP